MSRSRSDVPPVLAAVAEAVASASENGWPMITTDVVIGRVRTRHGLDLDPADVADALASLILLGHVKPVEPVRWVPTSVRTPHVLLTGDVEREWARGRERRRPKRRPRR